MIDAVQIVSGVALLFLAVVWAIAKAIDPNY